MRPVCGVGQTLRPSQTLPDHPAAGSLRRLDPTAPFEWADLGGGVGRFLVLTLLLLGRAVVVASYHLSASTVSRGRGQSAVADAQNQAYREAGIDASVDHRSLEAQREEVLERGDVVLAEVLDREPEPRLGVAATNVERRAAREAAAEGRDHEPVTEWGQAVVAIRAIRYEVEMVLVEWKGVRDRAASAYGAAREEGAGRIGAAIEAIRAVREPQGREEGGSGAKLGESGMGLRGAL